jgi:hypothetical protein
MDVEWQLFVMIFHVRMSTRKYIGQLEEMHINTKNKCTQLNSIHSVGLSSETVSILEPAKYREIL